MKALRITNKENNKWMIQESPTIFYPQTIDDYDVDSVNILTDQELEQLKEQVAREAWEAARTVVEGESYEFEWATLEDYYQQKNKGEG